MAPDSSWKSIFQSTPPRGRRRVHNCFLRSSQDISIHASAREATIDFIKVLDAPAISIHASAREATTGKRSMTGSDSFQSTPPRGRRRLLTLYSPYDKDFNPRLREGGDMSIFVTNCTKIYFNPRLREGGDTSCVTCNS